MKIDKQLFEDVLYGKLKGTFILRNGNKCNFSNLYRNTNKGMSYDYPYTLYICNCAHLEYTANGKSGTSLIAGYRKQYEYDIIDFIPDTVMKENELTIEIPDGKIVDWEESKKQNRIVLKDKQLTYEDVCEKLFKNDHYIIAWEGYPIKCCGATYKASNATTEHQLECILAKNKLANVAKYLNDGWKPDKTDSGHFDAWVLFVTPNKDFIGCVKIENCAYNSNVLFKSEELAQRAIKILGKKTIKLALEPLGI